MKNLPVLRRLLPVLLLIMTALTVRAQKEAVEGVWLDDSKQARFRIFKGPDNKFYGNLVWMKEPNENGRPKVDKNNPKPALRNQPMLNLQLLRHFKKTAPNTYEDGQIYDPQSGKTYSCKMTVKGDKLDLRGYIGISLIGKTTTWTRVQ